MISIQPINAFNDNYIWAIVNNNTQQCIIVDSGKAKPVVDFIEQTGLELTAIWITHKHYDHTGGVAELQQKFPNVEVIAHAKHGVRQDITVEENSQFTAWDYTVEVWHIAGHTKNHLAYLLNTDNQYHVFCGDTLFSSGCGRVFTGDMSAMFNSLQRLASLADDTLFYPAHEYTLSNLKFALSIEPNNQAIQQRHAQVLQLTAENKPSLPTSLSQEKQTNVFLQAKSKDEFSQLRFMKDNF